MKKLLYIIFVSVIIFSLTGCGKKDNSVRENESQENTTATINDNKKNEDVLKEIENEEKYQNGEKKEEKVRKEECIKVAQYGMDLSIAESKGDKNLAKKIRSDLEELEKKYGLEGSEFEKKCAGYMMDKDFLEMIQKKGYELQQRK